MHILALQVQIYFTYGYKQILTNLWVLIRVPIILSKLKTNSAIFIYLGISVYSVCRVNQLLNISELHESLLQSYSARIHFEISPFIIRMKDNCLLLIYALKSKKVCNYTKDEIMNKLYRNLRSDILSSLN